MTMLVWLCMGSVIRWVFRRVMIPLSVIVLLLCLVIYAFVGYHTVQRYLNVRGVDRPCESVRIPGTDWIVEHFVNGKCYPEDECTDKILARQIHSSRGQSPVTILSMRNAVPETTLSIADGVLHVQMGNRAVVTEKKSDFLGVPIVYHYARGDRPDLNAAWVVYWKDLIQYDDLRYFFFFWKKPTLNVSETSRLGDYYNSLFWKYYREDEAAGHLWTGQDRHDMRIPMSTGEQNPKCYRHWDESEGGDGYAAYKP